MNEDNGNVTMTQPPMRRGGMEVLSKVMLIYAALKVIFEDGPKLLATWNHAAGFWRNLNELRYLCAAQFNAMDVVVLFAIALLGISVGFFCGVLSRKYEKHKAGLHLATPSAPNKRSWLKRIRGSRIWARVSCTFLVISTGYLMIFTFLFIESYYWSRQFQKECTALRPFISDNEYHKLNRQWVTMTSRADYLAIKQQLAEYNKRIDLEKRAELVNEIFRARAAAQGEGKRKKQ